MEDEIFKDIIGYEGSYKVSNYGNVKSFKYDHFKGRLMKLGLRGGGYSCVNLSKDNKKITKAVHKLMQPAFELGMGFVDHINGIKTDNRLENLRVVTRRQNMQNLNCHRKGKLVGANYDKRRAHLDRPWASRVKINGKNIHLGCFKTELEAHEMYMKKLSEM